MTDADSSWKRRTVLQAGLAATGAGLLSPTVRGAAATSADRRPLYVTGPGGSPYPWTQYTIILDTDEVEKADPADSNDAVFHSSFQGETVITGRVAEANFDKYLYDSQGRIQFIGVNGAVAVSGSEEAVYPEQTLALAIEGNDAKQTTHYRLSPTGEVLTGTDLEGSEDADDPLLGTVPAGDIDRYTVTGQPNYVAITGNAALSIQRQ